MSILPLDSENISVRSCFRPTKRLSHGPFFLTQQVKCGAVTKFAIGRTCVQNPMKTFEIGSQTFPEKISVLRPNGTHAYWATEDQARKLIRERHAVGLGNARKFYKLRLTVEADRANAFCAGLKASTLAKVPVIRPYELLAPSPRRHFGFAASVNRRKQGSGQHGVYAHSLANQLEPVVSG